MVTSTLCPATVAKAATATLSAVSTRRASNIQASVTANRELLACGVISVLLINTDSRKTVASHATAMKVDRRDSSAMLRVNVRVTTMLKEDDVIDAKKINSIVIKDA